MPETNASILVVDDEPDLRLLYELTLAREGYRVECAETIAQARDKLQARFDAVLTDMRLPDGLGMELLLELRAAGRPERCIVVTGYGSGENAVEALRAGAFDYLSKPVELKQLRTVVASAAQGLPPAPRPPAGPGEHAGAPTDARAAGDSAAVRQKPAAATAAPAAPDKAAAALAQLVGQSPLMCAVRERISKVARSMAPVHIHGESGTGKELVARALHASSQRTDNRLVAVNCGAIPDHLLEAEFFGARKGAYTGATQNRDGFFQAARGGTLFLDEIGDLPLAMQTKLLRAIQERSVRPLGSTDEELVDVRLVSATHRDLAEEVRQGRFRQDLFYRLNVIELHIPPLRERMQDLPALAQALLQRLARDCGFENISIEPDFMRHLMQCRFPGNVRELENFLHRAVALSEDGVLRTETLPGASEPPAPAAGLPGAAPRAAQQPGDPLMPPDGLQHTREMPAGTAAGDMPADLQAWLDEQERSVLIRALQSVHYNRTAAAALLGLNLRQIRYRIERLKIPTEPQTRE